MVNQVYDATPYLEKHPGGSASITMNSGADATEDFEAVHSSNAWKILEDFYLGELGEEASRATTGPIVSNLPLITLDPKKKVPCNPFHSRYHSHYLSHHFTTSTPNHEP